LHHDKAHFLFHQGIFYPEQHHCHPPPTILFPLFLWLKIKLKARHFYTTQVIEAESQAVLTPSQNTTSMMYFKNYRSAGNGAHVHKWTASRVPKVSFQPDGSNQSRKLWMILYITHILWTTLSDSIYAISKKKWNQNRQVPFGHKLKLWAAGYV
jgi:hypothetical protein